MKKSERLHQELVFLHTKTRFQLQDLIDEFGISKRTALRDIADLEALGLPVYSAVGPGGGYRLVTPGYLPLVHLNEAELYTLFFALQLMENLENLPFPSSNQQIKQKLQQKLEGSTRTKLAEVGRYVQLEQVPQLHPSTNLADLFQAAVKKTALLIRYTRYQDDSKQILPLRLHLRQGIWYLNAYDFDKRAWRSYRCHDIHLVKALPELVAPTDDFLEKLYRDQQKASRASTFRARLTPQGKEFFLQRSYASMTLTNKAGQDYLNGQYHENEIPFLLQYFLSFGSELTLESPESLRMAYRDQLQTLLADYSK